MDAETDCKARSVRYRHWQPSLPPELRLVHLLGDGTGCLFGPFGSNPPGCGIMNSEINRQVWATNTVQNTCRFHRIAYVRRSLPISLPSSDRTSRHRLDGTDHQRRFVKAYLVTTGVIFGLITAGHVWKAIAEGPQTARNPLFLVLTALAAGMCVWAFWLVSRRSRLP